MDKKPLTFGDLAVGDWFTVYDRYSPNHRSPVMMKIWNEHYDDYEGISLTSGYHNDILIDIEVKKVQKIDLTPT